MPSSRHRTIDQLGHLRTGRVEQAKLDVDLARQRELTLNQSNRSLLDARAEKAPDPERGRPRS